MIKITLEQLINSSDGLKALSEKKLKARCAFAVGRLLKAVDGEMDTFNNARMELIKKYGEKDEKDELITDDKGNVHIPTMAIDQFNEELRELLDTPIEINTSRIKLDDVEDIEFTPIEIAQLEEFIEFEDEE